jgi:hypothetical protein
MDIERHDADAELCGQLWRDISGAISDYPNWHVFEPLW